MSPFSSEFPCAICYRDSESELEQLSELNSVCETVTYRQIIIVLVLVQRRIVNLKLEVRVFDSISIIYGSGSRQVSGIPNRFAMAERIIVAYDPFRVIFNKNKNFSRVFNRVVRGLNINFPPFASHEWSFPRSVKEWSGLRARFSYRCRVSRRWRNESGSWYYTARLA